MGRALVVSAYLLALACTAATASPVPAGPSPGISLQITFSARSLPLHYTLNCEPTSGTLAHAGAACAAIAANPKMVLGEPAPPYEGPRPLKAAIACPAPHETIEISGSYHGSRVDTTGGDSCSFNHVLQAWAPFLPTPAYLHEVRPDRGLEALSLGQSHAAVSALLGRPSTHVGAGAIFKDGSAITFHVTVPFALAVAYDRHARVATLISNGLPSLGRFDLTLKPAPPSPLMHWHHVICAGRHSLADHPLARHRSTTIVWPSIDHPTAIVTSEPFSACRIARATEQAPLAPGQLIR